MRSRSSLVGLGRKAIIQKELPRKTGLGAKVFMKARRSNGLMILILAMLDPARIWKDASSKNGTPRRNLLTIGHFDFLQWTRNSVPMPGRTHCMAEILWTSRGLCEDCNLSLMGDQSRKNERRGTWRISRAGRTRRLKLQGIKKLDVHR